MDMKLFELFSECTNVCIDNRRVTTNCLFIGIKGANFDGSNFAEQALASGAKYAIVSIEEKANQSSIFYVPDTLIYLQQLANYHRKKFTIPIIGITGSNGKTTSKELISTVLAKKYKVLFTEGNLNNHIGVPLTLLRLTKEHEIAVIEMGANKPGDIKELVEIAEPNFGIITNVGKAHLEGFKSLEGVIATKSELYDHISLADGIVFYNSDDTLLSNQIHKYYIKTITYGTNDSATIQGQLGKLDPFVHFSWKKENYSSPELSTHLVGQYNFYNFLAATTIGNYFGVTENDINEALTTYTPTNNRSQVTKTAKNTLIVDCYNANPSSMKSAIESFAKIQNPDKLLIIGDMLELGTESIEEHAKILQLIEALKLDVLTVGPIFKSIHQTGFDNTNILIDYLKTKKIQDKLILLKGSRGIALEKAIEIL